MHFFVLRIGWCDNGFIRLNCIFQVINSFYSRRINDNSRSFDIRRLFRRLRVEHSQNFFGIILNVAQGLTGGISFIGISSTTHKPPGQGRDNYQQTNPEQSQTAVPGFFFGFRAVEPFLLQLGKAEDELWRIADEKYFRLSISLKGKWVRLTDHETVVEALGAKRASELLFQTVKQFYRDETNQVFSRSGSTGTGGG